MCELHPRVFPGNPIHRSFQLVSSFSVDASEIIMEHPLTSPHLPDSPAVSPPDLTVCIVNWNSYDLLSKCLDSIFSTPCQSALEIIVVDNNSNDGGAEKLEISYPQIQLIRNMDNRGFGRANNQAIPAGFGRYYLFLNPDTLVLDETFDNMVAFMDAHQDAAVATGKVYESDTRDQIRISYGDRYPSLNVLLLNDLVTLTGLRRLFPNSRLIQRCVWTGYNPEQEQIVAQVTGAFMCVRRQAIEEVGVFDEQFFMYMEETDWCYRFYQAGWRVYYTPASAIVHIGEGSSRLRTDREQLYYQSICAYLYKHHGAISLVAYQACYYGFVKPMQLLRRGMASLLKTN